MAQFPSLPLFTDSWVADTKHLTRAERGTYLDLLILMWRTPGCRVPNDNAWLARRLGMTQPEVAAELRPIISEFCQSDGNCLYQKRLLKEWNWCRRKSRQQSVIAKSRWEKDKHQCESIAGVNGHGTTVDHEPAYAGNASPAMPPTHTHKVRK